MLCKSFSHETLDDRKDCKDYLTQTKPAKLSFSLSYNLINASRNIFLDALVAAFINGTWPLINSTYQFLFPDNSFCHGFLQALYRRLSEPHRFVSNVCCRFLCIPVIPTRRKVYLRNYWNTKKCQQHLTQTNLKIYWKIHCESTILDIYESRLAK